VLEIYVLGILSLVVGTAFGVPIPYLPEVLLVVLGWRAASEYIQQVKFSVGMSEGYVTGIIHWDAILIGLVYITGVIVLYPLYPLAVMWMVPWIVNLVLINIFAILITKGIVELEDKEEDEE